MSWIPLEPSRLWRLSLGLLGLLGAAAPTWAEEPPLSGTELVTIERTMALSALYGDGDGLARGLCVETQLKGRWPGGPLDSVSDRQADVLRQAVEACSAAADGLRLVAEVRRTLQERVARLEKFHAAIRQCLRDPPDDAVAQQCLDAAAKRPLSTTERQALVSAARALNLRN